MQCENAVIWQQAKPHAWFCLLLFDSFGIRFGYWYDRDNALNYVVRGDADLFVMEIAVRFNDCDALGHVNNGTYFTYMEEARAPIFSIFNPELDVQKWNLIVASARCDFLKQVHYGETLTVQSWIGRIGSSSFVAEHVLTNHSGAFVARGQATLIYFDYEQQRATALPDAVRLQLIQHAEVPVGVPQLRS